MEIKHLIRATKVLNLLFASIAENSLCFSSALTTFWNLSSLLCLDASHHRFGSMMLQGLVKNPLLLSWKRPCISCQNNFKINIPKRIPPVFGTIRQGSFRKETNQNDNHLQPRKGFPLQIIHVYVKMFIYGWAKAKKIQRFRSLYVQSQKHKPYRGV